jgi:hypothetical protein
MEKFIAANVNGLGKKLIVIAGSSVSLCNSSA